MKFRVMPAVVGSCALLAFAAGFVPSAGGQVSPATKAIENPTAATREAVRLTDAAQDVLKLARAKVDDEVTLAFIQSGGRKYDLTAEAVVYLRQEGVSDRVLTAMLGSQPPARELQPQPEPVAPSAPTAVAPEYVEPPPTPMVVESMAPSTVQVVPSTPYYSFYEPWSYSYSYWYDPWPYYGYPYFSVGWYWGSWYYPHHNHCWDGDWHDHHHHSSDHDWDKKGDSSRIAGNDPSRKPGTRGDTSSELASARGLTSGQRPGATANSATATTATRQDVGQGAQRAPIDRATTASRSDNTTAARSSAPTTSSPLRPGANKVDNTPANNRPATGRVPVNSMETASVARADRAPVQNRAGVGEVGTSTSAQTTVRGQNARPTSTWINQGSVERSTAPSTPSQTSAGTVTRSYSVRPSTYSNPGSGSSGARPTIRSGSVATAPSARVSNPTTTFVSRSISSGASSTASRPSMSYQSSGGGRSVSPRVGAGGASFSRSSVSSASRGSSVSSPSRASSGGGGFRGSSGGGRSR